MVTQQEICAILAAYSKTNASDWFLFLRARSGMELAFRAIKEILGEGEVITTPYTCITSVNPILCGGLKPVYQDIDPEYLAHRTVNKKLINKSTRAIMMQHTLGIIGDKSELREIADAHNLLLIEDSAHCTTRMETKNGAPIADISIHSFGVEKVIQATKFGGAIYLNPKLKKKSPELYDKLITLFRGVPQPPKDLARRIKLYKAINRPLQHTGSMKPTLKHLLGKTGLYEPPVAELEQDGKQRPAYALNEYTAKEILAQLPALPENYKHRKEATKIYRENLASPHFKIVSQLDEPMLAFPIRFNNRNDADRAYKQLTKAGYFIRRWYKPLLYPGANSYKTYNLNESETPEARKASETVLSLPTNLDTLATHKICEQLNNYAPRA